MATTESIITFTQYWDAFETQLNEFSQEYKTFNEHVYVIVAKNMIEIGKKMETQAGEWGAMIKLASAKSTLKISEKALGSCINEHDGVYLPKIQSNEDLCFSLIYYAHFQRFQLVKSTANLLQEGVPSVGKPGIKYQKEAYIDYAAQLKKTIIEYYDLNHELIDSELMSLANSQLSAELLLRHHTEEELDEVDYDMLESSDDEYSQTESLTDSDDDVLDYMDENDEINEVYLQGLNSYLTGTVASITTDNIEEKVRNLNYYIQIMSKHFIHLKHIELLNAQLRNKEYQLDDILVSSDSFYYLHEHDAQFLIKLEQTFGLNGEGLSKKNARSQLFTIGQELLTSLNKEINESWESVSDNLSLQTIEEVLARLKVTKELIPTGDTLQKLIAVEKVIDENEINDEPLIESELKNTSNLLDTKLNDYINTHNKGLVRFNDYFRHVTRFLRNTFMKPILHDVNLLIEEARDIRSMLENNIEDAKELDTFSKRISQIENDSRYIFWGDDKTKKHNAFRDLNKIIDEVSGSVAPSA